MLTLFLALFSGFFVVFFSSLVLLVASQRKVSCQQLLSYRVQTWHKTHDFTSSSHKVTFLPLQDEKKKKQRQSIFKIAWEMLAFSKNLWEFSQLFAK